MTADFFERFQKDSQQAIEFNPIRASASFQYLESTGADMKRTVYFAALAALSVSCNALAVGGIAQVTIIDRRSGVELTLHLYHGEYWVAGTPGATYAINIRNRIGERILAVTSVDGVNVISGATAGWNQTGYVFDPGAGYQIAGWRKSDAEVAAFTFTASPDSYAERTGRPANIGIIGVAIFRERQPQPVYAPPISAPPPDSADAAPVPRRQPMQPHQPMEKAPALHVPPVAETAPKLGTGHGDREASYVSHTDFSRMQPQPNEVIRIRYDSFENLVAMGIIERPHPALPTNPFPASAEEQYVPDPPAGNASSFSSALRPPRSSRNWR
jgi:hypothetical protein